MQYSKLLVEEFKKVFKEEHGKEYTDQETEEALGNMGGLFIAIL